MNEVNQAIERSRSHNEIVTLDLDDESAQAALDHILESYDGETDYARNGGTLEVWGWTDEQNEGEMDFRVHFRIA